MDPRSSNLVALNSILLNMPGFRFLNRTFVCVSVVAVALTFSSHCQAQRPNVLLICVDDLRPELGCYGKDYIVSPNIDSLASRGRLFSRHYVQAPTCGASRYVLLTGQYGPSSNSAFFQRAEAMRQSKDIAPSLPGWFRSHGYQTVSVGKVSHHPGGRGGADWDDDTKIEMPDAWDRHQVPVGPWQHPRGVMHGLAHGEIRGVRSEMDVYQSNNGDDRVYPDGWIVDEAIGQMNDLASRKEVPFFLAVGIIRPHLPFGAPEKYMAPYREIELPPISHPGKPKGTTTWHRSGEFMAYNRWDRDPNQDARFADEVRRHYAACVTYADASVGKLLDRLDELKLRENTVVVLWGDHGWHLGEHAVWGKHTLFEESLHSPLIISYAGLPQSGVPTDSIVETLDLFPTLCDLTGVAAPDSLHGVSLLPILESPDAPGHSAIAYAKASTIRDDRYRLIRHPRGEVELYDQSGDSLRGLPNVADQHPEVVDRLSEQLDRRLSLRGEKD